MLDTGSVVILSLVLCLELESLSLSFFLFGFFMFLTTLPVDLTGARLVFIGIVANIGFGTSTSTSVVNGAVVSISSTDFALEEEMTDDIVAGVSFGVLGFVETIVLSVVDVVSQWLLHLHRLLFSIGKPKRKIKEKIVNFEFNIRRRPLTT